MQKCIQSCARFWPAAPPRRHATNARSAVVCSRLCVNRYAFNQLDCPN